MELNVEIKLKGEKLTKIHYKMLHDEDLPTKPSSIKLNGLPIVFLLVTYTLMANIEMSNGIACHGTRDIKWISKKTNKVVGCTPCPRCPPSQEYSIPCGSEVYIGTAAKCISCPNGKYSDGFNFNPCVSCTICSNRIVKQNCTLFRNSICGKCKPGYYHETTSFGCLKCTKCCHDGHDENHASCSLANLCKSRPYDCPPTYTSSIPTVIPSSISKASSSSGSLRNHSAVQSSQHTTKPFTTQSPISQESKPMVNSSPSTGQSDGEVIVTSTVHNDTQKSMASSSSGQLPENEVINKHNPWIIAVIVLLSLVAIILSILVVLFIKYYKIKESRKIAESDKDVEKSYKPVSQNESPAHDDIPMEELGEDLNLEQFFHKNYKEVDKLCNLLYHKHEGMWDFERVAVEWKIEKVTVDCIRNKIHVDNGSPVRELLEVLCSRRLCPTVRQLADSIKSINSDAYEVLKEFLKSPERREE